jgi:hypothetical protein
MADGTVIEVTYMKERESDQRESGARLAPYN